MRGSAAVALVAGGLWVACGGPSSPWAWLSGVTMAVVLFLMLVHVRVSGPAARRRRVGRRR